MIAGCSVASGDGEIIMSLNELNSRQSIDAERLVIECLRSRRGKLVPMEELCCVAFGIFSGVNDRDTAQAYILRLAENSGADQRLVVDVDRTAVKID